MNNPHNLSTALLFTNGAYDKNCYPLTTMDELQQLTSHEYYQRQLAAYRSGDGEAKKRLAALIPQGRLKNETIRLHQMEHLVPSGWVFLDDDRPHTEITAEQRHALVEERLAQVGLRTIPHVAQRSASMKYHLLVPMLEPTESIAHNHALWAQLMEGILVLDPSTVNVNRLMFLTGEWLTPVDALLASPIPLLGRNDSEQEAAKENSPRTTYTAMSSVTPPWEGSGEAIAQRLVTLLCGTTTPPEGTRNTTLYEAAKQMAYLDGITEEGMLAAFAPLGYLGLPEREARQCIRSAMRHEKTWLYTLPPELSRAMEEIESFNPVTLNTVKILAKCPGINGLQSPCAGSFVPQDDNIAMSSVTPPEEGPGEAIPQPSTLKRSSLAEGKSNPQLEGTQVPELVSLFTSRVPENAREATASMLFAPLASYLNNTVTIRDVSNKVRNLQFTSIVVGNSSSGKGFVDFISDAIMERRRQQDAASWQALKAWEEQKKQVAKGEPAPIKPKVPLYLLTGNMTEPALLERMSTLEPLGGRAYLKVAEIDSLRKMQSTGTRLGGGQEIILAAFDTQRDYGALRVSAEAVSTITTLSLNIVASSTYPGTQEFFRTGCERGTIGRCDVSIVPDSREVPQYGEIDDGFRQQLDHYTDLLMSATGEIICPEADQLIETLRQEYNSPTSPLSYESNPEYYKLCHRQLLITKQKAIVLYICNAYQWDHTWDEWLRHALYYGMQSKISVFYNEIASWQQRQHTCVMHVSVAPPKSDLEQLPATFTTQQLRELKRTQAPEAEDKTINKRTRELLRQWVNRGRIIPIEGNSNMWQQI